MINLYAVLAVHTQKCAASLLCSVLHSVASSHYGQEKFCVLLSVMSVEVKEETLGNNYVFINTDIPVISRFLILRFKFLSASFKTAIPEVLKKKKKKIYCR